MSLTVPYMHKVAHNINADLILGCLCLLLVLDKKDIYSAQ